MAAFVAWAGASAPWWALAGASALAVLVASGPVWIVLAAAAFLVSVVIGARRQSFPAGRAAAAALIVNSLLRWDSPTRFGVSALVTGVVVVVIVVSGLSRRWRGPAATCAGGCWSPGAGRAGRCRRGDRHGAGVRRSARRRVLAAGGGDRAAQR